MAQKKIGGQPINPNLRKLTPLIAEAIRKHSGKSGREIEIDLIYGGADNGNAEGRTWRRYRNGSTSFKTFGRLKSVAVLACKKGWLDRHWMAFFMPGVSEDYILGKSEKIAQKPLHESLLPNPIDDDLGHQSCGEWERLFNGTTIEIEWAREQWLNEIKGVVYDEYDPIEKLWDSGEVWTEKWARRHKVKTRSLIQHTRSLIDGRGFYEFAESSFPDSLNEYINFLSLEEDFCSGGQRPNTQESHEYELMLKSCGKTVCEEYRAKDFTDDQFVLIALVTATIKEMGYDCSNFSFSQVHEWATSWTSYQLQKTTKQKRRKNA